LLSESAALAGFVFTAEDMTIQKQKPACAAAGRDKKHDRKTGQKGRPGDGCSFFLLTENQLINVSNKRKNLLFLR